MQCPKCQSTQVQLCSVAFDQGTITATATTKGQTYSYGTVADQGRGIVSGQARHDHHNEQTTVSQTAFAAQAAPPVNPIVLPLKFLAWLLVFLVAINLVNLAIPDIVRAALGWSGFHQLERLTWAAIIACAVWLFFGLRKLPTYKVKRSRWKKTWICNACANRFVPESIG